MTKRLISGALGILLLAGICVSGPLPVISPVPARQDNATLFKFKEGGIQFAVPAGWDAKPDNDGSVKVSPKTGGSAQIAFVALPIPGNMSADDKASFFDALVEKTRSADTTFGEYNGNETLGDMKLALRSFQGKNNGHEVEGMYFLLSAAKPVFIVLAVDKAAGAQLRGEIESVINSVKRIE